MKRVSIDAELLEKARQALGAKTPSETVTKALEDAVKRSDFWAAYDRFKEVAKEGPIFDPDWVAENHPEVAPKRRISAKEHRLPRKSSHRVSR